MEDQAYDVLVVGGGPVGLYAGFRAALLNLRVHIVDKGGKWGRGHFVPNFHNLPAHPGGISGRDLNSQLRRRLAEQADYASMDDFVVGRHLERSEGLYVLKAVHHPSGEDRRYVSRVVIIATGIVDRQPMIGGDIRPVFPYANKGIICYCEICDGYLARGKDVAVVGHGKIAALIALDLLQFQARKVTILTNGKNLFEGDDMQPGEKDELAARLRSKYVDVIGPEIEGLFGLDRRLFGVRLGGGSEASFDLAFSAMGIYRVNNELAVSMGGKTDEAGYIVVDENCRVVTAAGEPIPGLYAVGDVNYNWNQVLIGFGDADRAVIHAWSSYL